MKAANAKYLMLLVTGMLRDSGHSFLPVFLFASITYLLALGWLHLLMPQIERHAA